MTLQAIVDKLGTTVGLGAGRLDMEVEHCFASDLMSDVLTLKDTPVLITGLCNVQTIRTCDMANGERRICTAKRSYSIDGIENVMDFLDKLENDEVEGVEFLELRACDQSCAGALLSCDNRFLCGERMYARARKAAERERNGEMPRDREMEKYKEYLIEHSQVDEVQPRSMMVLDDDISKALEKMEKIEKMKVHLPQIDCGVCGAPTCEAFATDVVCGQADLHRCVFYRLHLEQAGKMTLNEGRSNMYSVWGDDRISGEIEV